MKCVSPHITDKYEQIHHKIFSIFSKKPVNMLLFCEAWLWLTAISRLKADPVLAITVHFKG